MEEFQLEVYQIGNSRLVDVNGLYCGFDYYR